MIMIVLKELLEIAWSFNSLFIASSQTFRPNIMSYYSSSASILDPYCAGGRYHGSVLADLPFDRRESYTSTYSSSFNNVGNDYTSTSSALSRRPSAFDRYVSYLSDELSPATRTSARRWTSNSFVLQIKSENEQTLLKDVPNRVTR